MIEFKFCICGTAGPRRNDHVQQGRRLDSDHWDGLGAQKLCPEEDELGQPEPCPPEPELGDVERAKELGVGAEAGRLPRKVWRENDS